MTVRDRISFSLFVLLWLIPLLYRGLTERALPGMPRLLKYLHNASCLFTESVKHWRVDYVQVQLSENGEWLTIPEEAYFQMQPFGHDRTRLHRFMDLSLSKAGFARRAELAAWLRQRYTSHHPSHPIPVAVRFVVGQYLIRREPPAGRWHKPPLEAFRPKETVILSTHRFDAKPSSLPPAAEPRQSP